MNHLKFLNYRVEEMSFSVNKELGEGDKNFSISPKIRVDLKLEQKLFVCAITVSITKEQATPVPFELTVKTVGSFALVAPGDLNALREESTTFLYPYVRSTVTAITVSANMPSYVLPVIDFKFSPASPPTNDENKHDTITIRPLTDEV